jgi:hypothetical protein
MPTVVYSDIPNERVPGVKAAARFDGATDVQVVDKGNGKSDVIAVFPDTPAAAADSPAPPGGEDAAGGAADPATGGGS